MATSARSLLIPTTVASASFFKAQHVPISTAICVADHRRTRRRGLTVVTRAGPSTSSYVFAFALPLSLLAATIFTSIKIADKLDRDYLEELEINQAIREAEEEDAEYDEEEEEDDDDVDISLEEQMQQQPEFGRTRTRNRPKREV